MGLVSLVNRNGIVIRLLTSTGQVENTSGMLRPELVPCASSGLYICPADFLVPCDPSSAVHREDMAAASGLQR